MEIERIDDIVVTRHLTLRNSDKDVLIQIGRPLKFPDGQDYFCPYQVIGLKDDAVKYAAGVDQLQALMLTLKKIGVELYTCAEYRSGQLYWLEISNQDLGLPIPDGIILEELKLRPK